jgi:O-antigen/teichoic acid export membrane protein
MSALRHEVARGTVINTAFQIGLAVVNLVKRFAVAAFLTREEFGVWGIILATLITLAWLKQVGIMDKYVQQSDPDQELAFQRAFTLELAVSCAYFVVVAAALPPLAAAYGHTEIILPGLVLATSVVITAFQTPAWIPYRRLQYTRQRVLTSVDPVVSAVGMIGLAAAGMGYWGLIAGFLAGSVAGAIACVATSAYPLRLRWSRGVLKLYAGFSGPLIGLAVANLLVIQGAMLVTNHAVGLAGVGAIGLATTVAAFSDRVDTIVSSTIYPAVCAVADRRERLAEVFIKSNRLALMWAMPFAVALALFADDLVRYVLGREWEPVVPLLIAAGLTAGVGQVAFNWSVFARALDRTRPLLVAALLNVAIFVVVCAPAIIAFGLPGYAAGLAAATLAQVALRTVYMRAMVGGFSPWRQLGRAIGPVLAPAALVLGERALGLADPAPLRTVAELVVYTVGVVACTAWLERGLLNEMLGYLRGRVAAPVAR